MKKILTLLLFVALSFAWEPAFAESPRPTLKRIYFALYTDSIKPVLNYSVNVVGEFSDGTFLPMDTSYINLTASCGELHNCEWYIPKVIDFEKVTFIATAKENPALHDEVTVYIKKDLREEYDELSD